MAINFWDCDGARARRHAPSRSLTHTHTPKNILKFIPISFAPLLPLPLARSLPSFPSPSPSFSCFAEPSYFGRQVNKVRWPCDPTSQWRGFLGFPDKEIIKRWGKGGRWGWRGHPWSLSVPAQSQLGSQVALKIILTSQINAFKTIGGILSWGMDSRETSGLFFFSPNKEINQDLHNFLSQINLTPHNITMIQKSHDPSSPPARATAGKITNYCQNNTHTRFPLKGVF